MAGPVSTDLVHDTICQRAGRLLIDAFHRIDDTVSSVGRARARILFEATSPLSLAVFRPVLRLLEQDSRIEVWFTTSDESWSADRLFRSIGNRDRVVSPGHARWMKFDAYINSDFWNMTWLRRRTRRVHLFHGVAGKYGLDAPVRIAPTVRSFDRLLFPNRDRLRRYIDEGLVDPNGLQGVLAGYPKVDCLVDGSIDRNAVRAELDLARDLPTVLYAPTWSPYSSLNAMGLEIIEALTKTLDVNVIVKLHDRSHEGTARGSGSIDWVREIEQVGDQLRTQLGAPLGRSGRVHVAESADASPYMLAADLLVTDHSSVGFEYMLLDRPVVVIDCPELVRKARINPEKVRLLRSGASVVGRASELAGAVRLGLSDPLALSTRRRQIADDLFYRPGSASLRAASAIYDVLELGLPPLAKVAYVRAGP